MPLDLEVPACSGFLTVVESFTLSSLVDFLLFDKACRCFNSSSSDFPDSLVDCGHGIYDVIYHARTKISSGIRENKANYPFERHHCVCFTYFIVLFRSILSTDRKILRIRKSNQIHSHCFSSI